MILQLNKYIMKLILFLHVSPAGLHKHYEIYLNFFVFTHVYLISSL